LEVRETLGEKEKPPFEREVSRFSMTRGDGKKIRKGGQMKLQGVGRPFYVILG